MEDITFKMVVGAIVVLVTNVVTLKWMRSDLKKLEMRLDAHSKRIANIYERMDKTMEKAEITELVMQCTKVIKEDNQETKETVRIMSDNVVQMTVSFARLDERFKTMNTLKERTDEH